MDQSRGVYHLHFILILIIFACLLPPSISSTGRSIRQQSRDNRYQIEARDKLDKLETLDNMDQLQSLDKVDKREGNEASWSGQIEGHIPQGEGHFTRGEGHILQGEGHVTQGERQANLLSLVLSHLRDRNRGSALKASKHKEYPKHALETFSRNLTEGKKRLREKLNRNGKPIEDEKLVGDVRLSVNTNPYRINRNLIEQKTRAKRQLRVEIIQSNKRRDLVNWDTHTGTSDKLRICSNKLRMRLTARNNAVTCFIGSKNTRDVLIGNEAYNRAYGTPAFGVLSEILPMFRVKFADNDEDVADEKVVSLAYDASAAQPISSDDLTSSDHRKSSAPMIKSRTLRTRIWSSDAGEVGRYWFKPSSTGVQENLVKRDQTQISLDANNGLSRDRVGPISIDQVRPPLGWSVKLRRRGSVANCRPGDTRPVCDRAARPSASSSSTSSSFSTSTTTSSLSSLSSSSTSSNGLAEDGGAGSRARGGAGVSVQLSLKVLADLVKERTAQRRLNERQAADQAHAARTLDQLHKMG